MCFEEEEPIMPKRRLCEILCAYICADYEALGSAGPVLSRLRTDCRCSDGEIDDLGLSWLLDTEKDG